MPSVRFQLAIPSDVYLAFYQGAAQVVSIQAQDGRRIEFPAEHLRPFVSHNGVYGEFELSFDAHNRFVSLRRLTPE